MSRILIILLSLSLMACTNKIQEYPSASIDVVPLEFSMKLNSKAKGLNKSKQNINNFIEHHKDQLLSQHVSVTYSNNQAKKLADYVQTRLLKQGAVPAKVSIASGIVANDKDFAISYTEHKVQAPVCGYEQIEKIDAKSANCSVEGARWKSMVHPEKMLLPQG